MVAIRRPAAASSSGSKAVLRRPAAPVLRRPAAASSSGSKAVLRRPAAQILRRPTASGSSSVLHQSSKPGGHTGRDTSSTARSGGGDEADNEADETFRGFHRFLQAVQAGRASIMDAPCYEQAVQAAKILRQGIQCSVHGGLVSPDDLLCRNWSANVWTAYCPRCAGW